MALLRGCVRVFQRHPDVLLDGQLFDEIEALEDEAHAPAAQIVELVLPITRDVLPVEPVLAAIRRIEHAENRQQCRLAAARGAGHRDILARPDLEIDPVERRGDDLAADELLGGIDELEHGFLAGYLSICRRLFFPKVT